MPRNLQTKQSSSPWLGSDSRVPPTKQDICKLESPVWTTKLSNSVAWWLQASQHESWPAISLTTSQWSTSQSPTWLVGTRQQQEFDDPRNECSPFPRMQARRSGIVISAVTNLRCRLTSLTLSLGPTNLPVAEVCHKRKRIATATRVHESQIPSSSGLGFLARDLSGAEGQIPEELD